MGKKSTQNAHGDINLTPVINFLAEIILNRSSFNRLCIEKNIYPSSIKSIVTAIVTQENDGCETPFLNAFENLIISYVDLVKDIGEEILTKGRKFKEILEILSFEDNDDSSSEPSMSRDDKSASDHRDYELD